MLISNIQLRLIIGGSCVQVIKCTKSDISVIIIIEGIVKIIVQNNY